MKKLVVASLFITGIFSFNSCARIGSPSGGPKDETPPVLEWARPDTLATNVSTNLKEIELHFDEYVQVKDYNKNVVVSPPLEKNPIVFPQSLAEKTVLIKLQAPLQANTTYSFNFGDAIQDYNEGNKLSNFSYVFSTGNYIDSLSVKGKVYPGFDFELPKKTLVGLYKIDETYNDSIILKNKPYYISRVDEKGNYNLKYLSPGDYKIIAFEDVIENSKYDPSKEKIAFKNEILSLKGDEVVDLKLFKEKPKYRVTNSEMKGVGQIVFRTEGAEEDIKVIPVGKEFKTAFVDSHFEKDSVNFWFNPNVDKLENKTERLRFAVQHKDKVDTLSVLYKTPIQEYKINFNSFNDSKFQPNQNYKIAGTAPIKSIDKSLINVFKDTIAIPFDVRIDDVDKQVVLFDFKKDLGEKYEINVFPNAITDIFEAKNDTLVYQFNTGVREDFGNLRVKVTNLEEDVPVILQLIKRGKGFEVVEERKSVSKVFEFNHLNPGEYYLRLLVDENRNGIWDSGNLLTGTQPEPVYIYPSKITIRALWDTDETWIIGKESEQFIYFKEEVVDPKNPKK